MLNDVVNNLWRRKAILVSESVGYERKQVTSVRMTYCFTYFVAVFGVQGSVKQASAKMECV